MNDSARRTAEAKKRRLEMSMSALDRMLVGSTIPEIANLFHRPVRTVDQCLRDLHIPSVFSPTAVSSFMGHLALRTEALMATLNYKPGVYYVRGELSEWVPGGNQMNRERLDDVLSERFKRKRFTNREYAQAEKDLRLLGALHAKYRNRRFTARDMMLEAAVDPGFYFTMEYAPVEAALRREATPEEVKKYCKKIVARYKRTKRGSK